ncbi:hypothetical protein RF11_14367 [Thelohanellus kitauei]|uniref:Uncharacterized protein n=1 Tax=Thelohanellus kitauei TaxID=669202 RepID=A0A0C2NCD3_THEKT|nr:hypothetical protein RF11_14367 [Thelohanellus kitauei]
MSGWRIKCIDVSIKKVNSPNLLYPQYLKNFTMEISIQDVLFGVVQMISILVIDEVWWHQDSCDLQIINAKIMPLSSQHFDICDRNCLALVEPEMRVYACYLDKKVRVIIKQLHRLTEYTYQNLILDRYMQTLAPYGDQNQMLVVENVYDKLDQQCKDTAFKTQ